MSLEEHLAIFPLDGAITKHKVEPLILLQQLVPQAKVEPQILGAQQLIVV